MLGIRQLSVLHFMRSNMDVHAPHSEALEERSNLEQRLTGVESSICVRACTWIYTCTHTYAYTHECAGVLMYRFTDPLHGVSSVLRRYMHTYTFVSVDVHVHMCMETSVCEYIYIYMYTHPGSVTSGNAETRAGVDKCPRADKFHKLALQCFGAWCRMLVRKPLG